MNSIIESLGVYLPPNEVTTAEILAGCRNPLAFPLERLTGIRSRRMAGVSEFSIDLASKAVARCLRNSRYTPRDIDLLICCNISRCDGPDFRFTFEPSTAVRLRQVFGLDRAVVFDITNACAGMFTGIRIADAAIKAGEARRVMVVSGEYISHLIQTAQKEIEGYMDPRLACLTVGDAGAALVLDVAPDESSGFLDIEIFTLGEYGSYCVAKVTEREHGGAIMFTDSLKLASVSIKQGVMHAVEVQERNAWPPDGFDHLIMHQTSETTLKDTAREINAHFGREICLASNTVSNLERRANTASTSHFVALMDRILDGSIRSGQKIVFGISGSGLTIGTAVYALDDLPDRMRRAELEADTPQKRSPESVMPSPRTETLRRVRIETVGILGGPPLEGDSIAAASAAAEIALDRSIHAREDIGVVIYTGVYRSDFISEPAIGTMLAGELGINSRHGASASRTLAFDVFNGALGTLNACCVAAQMIRNGQCETALVCASEIENNATIGRTERRGLSESASGMVLDGLGGEAGFGRFLFRSAGDGEPFRSYTRAAGGKTWLQFEPGDETEEQQIQRACEAVRELLELEDMTLETVKWVLPPQISSGWSARLALSLGLPLERLVDVTVADGDLFTSSLAFAIHHLQQTARASAGDVGLIVAVGSGGQVGCATYTF